MNDRRQPVKAFLRPDTTKRLEARATKEGRSVSQTLARIAEQVLHAGEKHADVS